MQVGFSDTWDYYEKSLICIFFQTETQMGEKYY